MPKTAKHPGVDTSPVTIRQVKYATVIAFLAWTFAVYDFILFGMLLPEIGKSINLDDAGQAQLATYVALGGVVVALAVGPVVDKFGRRFGMVFTVGGAGVASALTALAGGSAPSCSSGSGPWPGWATPNRASTAPTSASSTPPATTRNSPSAAARSTAWCRAAGRSARCWPPA